MNTPAAFAVLHTAAAKIRRGGDKQAPQTLMAGGTNDGVFEPTAGKMVSSSISLKTDILSPEEIEAMIKNRMAARQRRDFAAADKIRDELIAHGVRLEDSTEKTTWRIEF